MSHKQENQPRAGYQQNECYTPPPDTGNAYQRVTVQEPDRDPRPVDTRVDPDWQNEGSFEFYLPQRALDLDFEACFYEHNSTKTVTELYWFVGLVYKYTKMIIYNLIVVLMGIPMALLWAVMNALFVFMNVWLMLPSVKLSVYMMYSLAPLVTVPLHVVLKPLVDVYARIYRQVHIKATVNGNIAEKLV